MADQWYYTRGGQQAGPVSIQQLKELAGGGQLQPTDMVWTEGMANWQEAQTIPDLFAPSSQSFASPPQGTPVGYQPLNYHGTPPPNYLVQSILVTICCCLPFGIVGIVYAAQVNGKYQAGDVQGAMATSANAKKWSTIGFVCGLVINLLVFGIQIFAVGAGGF